MNFGQPAYTKCWPAMAIFSVFLQFCCLSCHVAFAKQQQEAEPESLELPKIDQLAAEFMVLTGANSATVAISDKDQILFSKGYGFSDQRQRIATQPFNTMRLASCSKPYTTVVIIQLISNKTISRDTLVYEYLGIEDRQGLADPRVKQITVGHLLDHSGGWDRLETFDPMYRIGKIKDAMGVSRVRKSHIVQYMWRQSLQFDPGEKECYSNFGYLLLGLIIEKATGQSYIEAVRSRVTDPLGIDNLSISSPVRRNRESREVYYSKESNLNLQLRDSCSGLTTNSESLCRFMQSYWLDGEIRDSRRNVYFFQVGTHPFMTTTIMEQRLDGLNYAVMLNSRREEHYNEDNSKMRDKFTQVLDELSEQLRFRD